MSDLSKRHSTRSLLREPLLHFLLLGVLVFAIDYGLSGDEETGNAIVLSAKIDDELIGIFHDARQREPNAEELDVLRQRWIDNEVLYREGLAMGLDQGDTAIRERIIFKSLNVVQSNIQQPRPTDNELESWFEENRDRYDEPPRIDFLEAVLSRAVSADEFTEFVAALNEDRDFDVDSNLRIFKGRPRDSIVAVFGDAFANKLDQLELDTWHLLDSDEGQRVIMIEERRPLVPAVFADIRAEVLQDWRDLRMQELRTEAVRELANNYTIRLPEPDRRTAAINSGENAL